MSKLLAILLMWFLIGGSTRQASAYALQYADDAKTMRLRWKTNLIPITFSTSLTKPNLYIRPESDITGAIERSLNAWENAADIKFQVSWTDKQSVSPSGKSGDGMSLVTVAQTPENLLLFGGDAQEVSARTRIFFNRTGGITEADIVLNPYEQFSTDGSVGTFDLESTLTHEIGHLLGLEHASVTGATMNAHTGKNGVYNLPSFSSRTLAQDDINGIRALYGADDGENCCGAVSGKLILPIGKAAKNFQVWAEESESGRVAAGVITSNDGTFKIEGLSDGNYRIYTQDFSKKNDKSSSVESLGAVEVKSGKTTNIAKKLSGKRKNFALNYVGFNGQISELAVPVNGGKSYMIYVGGSNLRAANTKIGFNSPHLSITPGSLTDQDYGTDISVVSFEIKVAADIPFGEYSFFIQMKDEEIQFAVGNITVEQFANPWNSYFILPE